MNKLMRKHAGSRSAIAKIKRQTGVTLMETMIALALSAVVTSAMVILMANSLGTATRIIHMSQLTDELRNAMSMMTRDVRRANYSANAIFCYGNSDCGAAGGIAQQVGDIELDAEQDASCFLFALDRGQDGNATNDPRAGFRRRVIDGVGVIQVFTGAANANPPSCNDSDGAAGWVAVTDPDTVNITVFNVNDGASITKVFDEGEGKFFTDRQRQVQIALQGQLLIEEARNATMVTRRIEDTIYVRNDFIILPAS
jgi:prepilin peptidase dependent protein B